MARPSKLTDNFLKVTNKILNDDINCVILTDEELLFLINEELTEPEQITDRTFEAWKANSKDSEFLRLIKKAKIKQKRNLVSEMRTKDKNWQVNAWILERKFTEYNLKKISEVEHKVNDITININLAE